VIVRSVFDVCGCVLVSGFIGEFAFVLLLQLLSVLRTCVFIAVCCFGNIIGKGGDVSIVIGCTT